MTNRINVALILVVVVVAAAAIGGRTVAIADQVGAALAVSPAGKAKQPT